MFKKLLPLLIVISLSYWSIQAFFLPGFFPMHDDTQVARVFEMHKSLGDGLFPVRLVADLGYHYGYPIFNFYAPFAYYIGALFMFIGFDALLATKAMMAFGAVLAGVFMYLFTKEFWGKTGGIISALLYVYAPYHALNIYVRGAVAEFWAYAFIPLVFYGLWKANKEQQWKYVVVASLGFAAVIVSHNLTAMMITPFLLLFAIVLFFQNRKHKPYLLFTSLILGILLATFYWLPVFAEMQYTNVESQVGGGSDYKDHFVCPVQLWDSQWGFGGSTPTCVDGMSYKIGKLHTVLFVIGTIAFFWQRKKEKAQLVFGSLAVASSFFALFLLLSPSQFLWDSISQMAFLQFPWRFLLLVTFFVSFLGGASSLLLEKFIPNKLVVFGITGLLLGSIIYFNSELFAPQKIVKKTVDDYINLATIRWTTSKISDEYMPQGFAKPKTFQEVPVDKITIRSGEAKLSTINEKTQEIAAKIEATEPTDLIFHHAYFPGWKVFMNGTETDFTTSNQGLLVTVPSGTHTVVLKYSQTPTQKVGNILSLTGVLIIVAGIIRARKLAKHVKKST